MKKNKILLFTSFLTIPTIVLSSVVSCSKGEDLDVWRYDKNYGIYFNGLGSILDYDGNAIELEIPEYLENNGDSSSPYYGKKTQVKFIDYNAFKWDEKEDSGRLKLQKIKLPNSLSRIWYNAFDGNEITSIDIPNSVERIDSGAFGWNPITNVTIPNSVKYLSGFENTQLTNITIPNSVIEIGERAFYNTELSDVIIPNSVKISDVIIPNSVTKIGANAFSGTQLTQVEIPNSVKYLSGFNNTQLTNITIPNSVTIIGDGAFHDCNKLTSITIPNSVIEIGERAFYNTELSDVIIPNSVNP